MSNARLPRALFFVIVVAAFLQCMHDLPQLPNRIASHFGPSGMPNGWMSKTPFVVLYAVMVLVAASAVFLVPRSIAKTSNDRIHLPHKEYWLAPERRAETWAYFERHFAWYGCVFLLLIVFAMELVIQANFRTPPQLSSGPFLFLILAFLLFNLVWVIQLFRRFSKTPQA